MIVKKYISVVICLFLAFQISFITLASTVSASSEWSMMDSGTGAHLQDVWGVSPSNIFAVGSPDPDEGGNAVILHYNGTDWSTMESGTSEWLYGIWGTDANDIFAVGANGTVIRYDGTSWNAMTSNTTAALNAVWGSASDDIFAVGVSGTIIHYDGTGWAPMNSNTSQYLYGIWGSGPNNVYATGGYNTILHYDGDSWTVDEQGIGNSNILFEIWGSSASDIFTVGTGGDIFHYDGSTWSQMDANTSDNTHLYGVEGSSSSDIYAVGFNFDEYKTAILHYDGYAWSHITNGFYGTPYGTWVYSPSNACFTGGDGFIIQYANTTLNTYSVTNTSDSGEGSLRQAILDANSNTGPDTISFNIPGNGPHIINSALPEIYITDPVAIDGYTQTGSTKASSTTPANLQIVLNWIGGASYARGLVVQASGCNIQGLVVTNFTGAGIAIVPGSNNNVIQGNYIGTDSTGTNSDSKGNGNGIVINGSGYNLIGGTTPEARNLISGNHFYGIYIDGENSISNVITGNYIGCDSNGTFSLGYQTDGIRIVERATNNIIGGTTSGERNIISGNTHYGIVIGHEGTTDNQIAGNFIGTDYTGTAALGNGEIGIILDGYVSETIIGGTEAGAGNLISGNVGHDIQISSFSYQNQVQGNLIGTDITGTEAIGNGKSGIMIHGSDHNTIGGDTPNARNVISGHVFSGNGKGIQILSNAAYNLVQGNYIGTDISGENDLGNAYGIHVWSAQNNSIIENRIRHNTVRGVNIDQGTEIDSINNTVSRNSITANGGTTPGSGIRLVNGANQGILPPVIAPVLSNEISGTASGAPDGSIVEIFHDSWDQGEVYIGSTTVSGGEFTYTGSIPAGAIGRNITATVTDLTGNTSQFSTPVVYNPPVLTTDIWSIETIDYEGYVGAYTSIDIDAAGNPHISYSDSTNKNLKYAYFDGTDWKVQTVDATGNAGYYTSIALDSAGNPHISYDDSTNEHLKYAYYHEGGWNFQTVDSGGYVGSFSSLALDSDNNPHISYIDYSNTNLKYAYYDGTWNIETVDSAGQVGYFTSIALDSSGNPHISYFDWSNYDLKYAYHNDTGWHIETVDSTGQVGFGTSIGLDKTGTPHVAYIDLANRDLKHAYYDGAIWRTETVDSESNIADPSLVLDSSGNPHIAYSNGNLKYAYFDGTAWQLKTIDSTGVVGFYPSLDFDSSEHPHISYFDLSTTALKYAHRVEMSLSESETVSTSEGDIQVSISEGSFSTTPEMVSPGTGIPDGFLTPYGAVSFTISTDPGATVTIVLTFPEDLPPGTTIFKCIDGTCSVIADATISGNQAVFNVTDGGELDEDHEENGLIVDPTALAIPKNSQVIVEIKPPSSPAPLNVKSAGKIPVTIFGADNFDITTVNPETIRLAGLAPISWAFEDAGSPVKPFRQDGITDLTLTFDSQELIRELESLSGRELVDRETLVVYLTGNLLDEFGAAGFTGEDRVLILNNKR